MHASNDLVQGTKQSLNTLNVKRKSLELEADALVSELTAKSPGGGEPMGIDTPLVDSEGYPRADIDIYRARTLRKRLAEIRTDHKNIMKDIERTLAQLATLQNPDKSKEEREELEARMKKKPKPKFDPLTGNWVVRNWDGTVAGTPGGEHRSFDKISSTSSAVEVASLQQQQQQQQQHVSTAVVAADGALNNEAIEQTAFPTLNNNNNNNNNLPSRPFARVASVAPLSPAEQAGLHVDDLILLFDQISMESSSNPMGDVAELVPRSAGEEASIPIVVRRQSDKNVALSPTGSSSNNNNVVSVSLRPRPWSGKGLIGMHIVPFTD